MAASFVKWMTGRIGNSSELSLDDIDQALENVCRVPPPSLNDPKPRIAASNFVKIAELLRSRSHHTGDRHWDLLPRIYTVLRAIKRQDAMGTFVELGMKDFLLPFHANDLPDILGQHRTDFLQYQQHVETKAIQAEMGDKGGHLNFSCGDDHFRRDLVLGKGGSGTVDKVLSRLTWNFYARKRIKRGIRGDLFKMYSNEIDTLKRLKHEHLVRIMGTYTDLKYFAFLMLPIAQGNMKDFLNAVAWDPRLRPTLRPHFGCIAGTIAYLHKEDIYHMDIKLENILILGENIYVTDFGTAKGFSNPDRSLPQHTPILAWTQRYIPPELAKNPRSPRNAATDMWSLGVVFLEMVSVLRGKTLKYFRDYLKINGTKSPYIYNNSSATFSWFEVLQTSTTESIADNEPLMWAKDLFAEKPHNRPTAQNLVSQILKSSSAEQWHGICCETGLTELISDEDPAEAVVTTVINEQPAVFAHSERETFGTRSKHLPRDNSILKWQSNIKDDFEIPMDVPGAWGEYKEFEDEPMVSIDISEDDQSRSACRSSQYKWLADEGNFDPTELPYDLTEDVTEISSDIDEIQHDELAQKLQEFEFLDRPAPDYRVKEGELGDYDGDLEYEVDDDASSSAESQVTITPFSDISDETEIHTVKSQNIDDKVKQTSASEKAALEDPKPDAPLAENTDLHTRLRAAIMAKVGNPYLHQPQSASGGLDRIQEEPNNEGTQVSDDASEETDRDLCGQSVGENQSPVCASKTLPESGESMAAQMHRSQDSINTEPGSMNNQEEPPEAIPKPQSSLTAGNLKSFLDSQPAVEMGAGCGDATSGDETPNARILPQEYIPSRPALDIIASNYIDEVYKAESEAATSVMSQNTQEKIGYDFGITRGKDRLHDLLGQFAKAGSASAVRELLARRCNPGTVSKPRPKPLLAAISGRSERHNKCARALLEYGANPNVKRKGKRALHIAIENKEFKGYTNLIMMLLQNGANPNASDTSGDTPLLKILLGGYQPLQVSKRDAMALLMWFEADVHKGPKGTLQKPIHLAVRRNDPWAVSFLLHKGAKVDEKDGAGQTPFAMAVSSLAGKVTENQKEVLRQLLQHGADVNERIGIHENTALHVAVGLGDRDVAAILVRDFKADLLRENAKGLAPRALLDAQHKQKKCTDEVYAVFLGLLSPL